MKVGDLKIGTTWECPQGIYGRYVDNVIENFGKENSFLTIKSVMPNFIVVGSDWAKKDYYKQMNFTQEWLDENNIILIYLPYTKNISSTNILEHSRKFLVNRFLTSVEYC